MPLPERDLIGHIIHLSRSIERLCDEASRATGVTGSQARLLVFLSIVSGEQDIFQKDIEEEFGVRPSSVTAQLQALERQGFIRRDSVSCDARLKKIVLTDKAREVRKKITGIHRGLLRRILGPLSDVELQSFMQICRGLTERASQL